MKKIIMIAFFSVFVLALAGCEPKRDLMSDIRSERESSRQEEAASREAEIKEVDKWGISLDDVDRLAKQAIRKHENAWDYKRDYKKAIKVTDDILEDIEKNPQKQHDMKNFIEKYKESCDAGIDFLKSCVDVEYLYNLFLTDNEFDRSEKDAIRLCLTMYNSSIQSIENSILDMEALLNPIIEENRTLTDDELKRVYEIYQILIDKAYSTSI